MQTMVPRTSPKENTEITSFKEAVMFHVKQIEQSTAACFT